MAKVFTTVGPPKSTLQQLGFLSPSSQTTTSDAHASNGPPIMAVGDALKHQSSKPGIK